MKKAESPKKSSQQKNKTLQRNHTALTPRLERLLKSLMQHSRSTLNLIGEIPTTNPARYVEILRKEHGFDLPCAHQPHVTVDGNSSWYGVYSLSVADRTRAEDLLGA